MVFNLSYTTASRYATIAQHLLDRQLELPVEREPFATATLLVVGFLAPTALSLNV